MDNLFEGDIILTPDQEEIMESSTVEEHGVMTRELYRRIFQTSGKME